MVKGLVRSGLLLGAVVGVVASVRSEERRRLGPGSVMFHGANELHGLRNVGEGPATYHVIKWTVASAEAPAKP